MLRTVWMDYPDLRLGQLIENAAKLGDPSCKLFYVEEDFILAGLVIMAYRAEYGDKNEA